MYTTSIEGLWFAFFSIPGAIFGTHNGTIEISWVTVKNCPLSLEATTGKAEARQLEKAAGKIHPPPFAAKTVTRDCELRPLQFFPGKTRNSKVKNWISSDITRSPTCNYTPTPTASTIDVFNGEWWRFFWSRTPKQPWRLETESSDVWIPAAIQGQPLVAAMTSGLQGSNDHLESHPSWEICKKSVLKWLITVLHGASLTFFQAEAPLSTELWNHVLEPQRVPVFVSYQLPLSPPHQSSRLNIHNADLNKVSEPILPRFLPRDTLFFLHVSLMCNQPLKHHVSMVGCFRITRNVIIIRQLYLQHCSKWTYLYP